MEQKDYLLKEIEKIRLLLRAILNSIIGRNENLALTLESQFEDTKDLVFDEIGFDIESFLTLSESASKDYFSQFKGFSTENLEVLAEILFTIGINTKSEKKKIYLEKTLELYKLCNSIDKTFSFERENKIEIVKMRF